MVRPTGCVVRCEPLVGWWVVGVEGGVGVVVAATAPVAAATAASDATPAAVTLGIAAPAVAITAPAAVIFHCRCSWYCRCCRCWCGCCWCWCCCRSCCHYAPLLDLLLRPPQLLVPLLPLELLLPPPLMLLPLGVRPPSSRVGAGWSCRRSRSPPRCHYRRRCCSRRRRYRSCWHSHCRYLPLLVLVV